MNLSKLPQLVIQNFITLTLKVKSLEFVSEYHPISLCNVLYKIFSKVSANKLKTYLPDVIIE